MLRSLRTKLLATFALLASAAGSQAAFSVTVTQTSALPSPGASYSSSLTNQPSLDILPGAPQLVFGYDITNVPASGYYQINGLQFFYANSAVPISLRVTITETAANLVGNGVSLLGTANYELSGNTGNLLDSTITFQGTGANTIIFPSTTMSNTPVLMSGSTNFTSTGANGQIQSVFNFTLQPFSNATIGDISASGFGVIRADIGAVPVPATALLGLFGVPTLAILRRRLHR
jgi:hypothetical protein